MRQKLRQLFADKFLKPILDSLHLFLVLSIVLFVIGLLYQLWDLSLSTDRNSAILIITSLVGTSMVFSVAIIIFATLLHAVVIEESPFATPLSVFIGRRIPNDWKRPFSFHEDQESDRIKACSYLCSTVPQMTERDHLDHVSTIPVQNYLRSTNGGLSTQHACLTADTIVRLLDSDTPARVKNSATRTMIELVRILPVDFMVSAPSGITSDRLFNAFYSSYTDARLSPLELRLSLLRGMELSLSFVLHREYVRMGFWLSDASPIAPYLSYVFSLELEDIVGDYPNIELIVEAAVEVFCDVAAENPRELSDSFGRASADMTGFVSKSISVSYVIRPEAIRSFSTGQVNEVLKSISTVSGLLSLETPSSNLAEKKARLLYLLSDLTFFHFSSLVIPTDLDLSNLIEHLVSAERRNIPWLANSLLALLSVMDSTVFSRQRGVYPLVKFILENYSNSMMSRITTMDLHLLLARVIGMLVNSTFWYCTADFRLVLQLYQTMMSPWTTSHLMMTTDLQSQFCHIQRIKTARNAFFPRLSRDVSCTGFLKPAPLHCLLLSRSLHLTITYHISRVSRRPALLEVYC